MNAPQLGFPSQLGLGKHTHINQIRSPLSVHQALRPRRELRALHTHDTLILKQPHLSPRYLRHLLERLLYSPLQPPDELQTERISKCRMRDDGSSLEEARGTDALGPIDDLRGEDERSRSDFLSEGTDGRECDDGAYAERFEGGDVGTGGDEGWGDAVPFAMTSEKGDLGT